MIESFFQSYILLKTAEKRFVWLIWTKKEIIQLIIDIPLNPNKE